MFNKYIKKCNFLFCKDDLLTFTVLWFVDSNILTLMNTFDLPEGNITESNYDSILQHLNSTAPAVFQELQLKTCEHSDVPQPGLWFLLLFGASLLSGHEHTAAQCGASSPFTP